jgi:hypothetical protein
MPLIPAALPAVADRRLPVVRFAMKDGSKLVTVLVANSALRDVERSLPAGVIDVFKRNRKLFERIASEKYGRRHVQEDGTVYIRTVDVAPDRAA